MSDLIERLRTVQRNSTTLDSIKLASDCIDEIERLTEERDDARVEACAWVQEHLKVDPQLVANERGWDCFKEAAMSGDPIRAQMLRRAADVTVERGKTYGPPAEHFERTTRALHALMPDLFARPPLPEDWAKCMMIDKLARDAEVPKEDNCIDIAGYAACLYEVRKCDSSEVV